VLEGVDRRAPYTFLILVEDIPGFGSEELILTIDPSGYDEESIVRLRRTFRDPHGATGICLKSLISRVY